MIGIIGNTSKVSETSALDYLAAVEDTVQLPCCDPVRTTGVSAIVGRLIKAHELKAA